MDQGWTFGGIGNETVLPLVQKRVEPEDANLKVGDLLDENKDWVLSRLKTPFPRKVMSRIWALPVDRSSGGRDVLLWGASKDGSFSVKLAYDHSEDDKGPQPSMGFRWIWKWKGPQRLKTFLWLAFRDRLLTNCLRKRRGMAQSARCPVCQTEDENVLHVLRDCLTAADFWISSPHLCFLELGQGDLAS